MADALDGLDAARRAGWARAFDAEEAAANMLYELFLGMYLNSPYAPGCDLHALVGRDVRRWLDAANPARGWVNGAEEPPPLTSGQVDARIRIARRFLELNGCTAATWDDPPTWDGDEPPY